MMHCALLHSPPVCMPLTFVSSFHVVCVLSCFHSLINLMKWSFGRMYANLPMFSLMLLVLYINSIISCKQVNNRIILIFVITNIFLDLNTCSLNRQE